MKAILNWQSEGQELGTTELPSLGSRQWMWANLLGAVFILMALLQLISFSDFKDALNSLGIAEPQGWVVGIILAELLAAAGMFKLRLSYLARTLTLVLAILVSGFWFIFNLQSISGGLEAMPTLGFFGGFLNQSPGWWTTIETLLLLGWTLYIVSLINLDGRVSKR